MYQFEIEGVPAVQKQTEFRFLKDGRKIPYNPSKMDIERVRWLIRPLAPKKPLSAPIALQIVFYMPIPQDTSKARRRQMNDRIILPIQRPDVDNLAYLITNALKTVVYEDDSQICKQVIYKFFSDNPRTIITVRKIQTAFHHDQEEVEECDEGNL